MKYICTYEDSGLKPCEVSAMDCAGCEYYWEELEYEKYFNEDEFDEE